MIIQKLPSQFQKYFYDRIGGGRNSEIENVLSAFSKGEAADGLE